MNNKLDFINRRGFIKGSAKIGAGLVAGSLLSGCDTYRDLFDTKDPTYPYTPLNNGITWCCHKQVIAIGASGTGYDNSKATSPTVIKIDSTYKMWYAGNNGFNSRILYSESSDGVNWSNFQLAVDFGASGLGYDVSHFWNPSVIKDGSTYKMWYGGNSGTNRILYCESSDGVNWSNFQLAVDFGASGLGYDSTWSQNPTVIKDRSTYKMWYSGYNGNWRIIYCESSDGINWSNFNLSIATSSTVAAPTVVNDKGVGKMWYNNSSTNTIWYAESW